MMILPPIAEFNLLAHDFIQLTVSSFIFSENFSACIVNPVVNISGNNIMSVSEVYLSIFQ